MKRTSSSSEPAVHAGDMLFGIALPPFCQFCVAPSCRQHAFLRALRLRAVASGITPARRPRRLADSERGRTAHGEADLFSPKRPHAPAGYRRKDG